MSGIWNIFSVGAMPMLDIAADLAASRLRPAAGHLGPRLGRSKRTVAQDRRAAAKRRARLRAKARGQA